MGPRPGSLFIIFYISLQFIHLQKIHLLFINRDTATPDTLSNALYHLCKGWVVRPVGDSVSWIRSRQSALDSIFPFRFPLVLAILPAYILRLLPQIASSGSIHHTLSRFIFIFTFIPFQYQVGACRSRSPLKHFAPTVAHRF